MTSIRDRLGLFVSSLNFLRANYPKRLARLLLHFVQFDTRLQPDVLKSTSISEWISDLICYCLDILFVPEMIEIILLISIKKIRKLSKEEKKIVGQYFGNSIDSEIVKMNPKMFNAVNKNVLAFVSFNHIHYEKDVPSHIFIHELVHIWQYQKFGSVYIPRALKAQRSTEGYDYGGIERLFTAMTKQEQFLNFNFEQQGEIFEDYAQLLKRKNDINPIVLSTYEYFIEQVRC